MVDDWKAALREVDRSLSEKADKCQEKEGSPSFFLASAETIRYSVCGGDLPAQESAPPHNAQGQRQNQGPGLVSLRRKSSE